MTAFDTTVLLFTSGVAGRYVLLDWTLVFFAAAFIYLLVAAFLLYVYRLKSWKERAGILASAILGAILSRGIVVPLFRFFLDIPRPFVALGVEPLIAADSTSAFPSGHMAFAVPFAAALWYANRRAGIWFSLGVLLMGMARVGAGAHWPTDILGGILVGLISFAAVYAGLKRKAVIIEPAPEKAKGAPVGAHQ